MEETNMEEMPMSAEERLKQINAERRELQSEVAIRKSARLEKAAVYRKTRDIKIKEVDVVLKEVQKEIFVYNKSGIRAKGEIDILANIKNLISLQDAKAVEETEEVFEIEPSTSTGY